MAPGHRPAAWPTCSGRTAAPVVASPRQILRAPARAPRRARLGGRRRHRARVPWSSRTPTSEAADKGYDQPAPRQPLQRRLLDDRAPRASSRCSAGSATRWRGAGMRVENSKGECNLGQHEINFRLRDPCSRPPTSTSSTRTGAKEIADQEGMAITLHGQVRRARGQLLPHPPLAPARRRLGRLRGRRRGVRPLPGRPARLPARALLPVRAERELLQALRGGLVRADGRGLGPRQPDLRPARRRPWAEQADRAAAAGRRRQPLPRAERDHRRRAARRSTRSSSSSPPSRATRTRRTSRACRRTLRTARDTFAAGSVGRAAFGEEVVDHYLNVADVELDAFEATVTDWERVRGFERL